MLKLKISRFDSVQYIRCKNLDDSTNWGLDLKLKFSAVLALFKVFLFLSKISRFEITQNSKSACPKKL